MKIKTIRRQRASASDEKTTLTTVTNVKVSAVESGKLSGFSLGWRIWKRNTLPMREPNMYQKMDSLFKTTQNVKATIR